MILSVIKFAETTISLIFICMLGVSGDIVETQTYRDVLVFRSATFPGLSMGGFIVLRHTYDEDWMVAHEYGHILQQRSLGGLYLPIVGLSSLYRHFTHTYGWPETWADELAGVTP